MFHMSSERNAKPNFHKLTLRLKNQGSKFVARTVDKSPFELNYPRCRLFFFSASRHRYFSNDATLMPVSNHFYNFHLNVQLKCVACLQLFNTGRISEEWK